VKKVTQVTGVILQTKLFYLMKTRPYLPNVLQMFYKAKALTKKYVVSALLSV
jgi:hypothetical protein